MACRSILPSRRVKRTIIGCVRFSWGALLPETMLLADRGYDADWIRELARRQGAWANIPGLGRALLGPIRRLHAAGPPIRGYSGRAFERCGSRWARRRQHHASGRPPYLSLPATGTASRFASIVLGNGVLDA